ncbi:MAG: hypothetical protein OXI52_09760 [Caldilineaceae bacterium]|nr:hypothetical protein [Caldilineaceae bacterium]
MARLDKQILHKTSFRFTVILAVLVCVFTLSGCGGSGGGSSSAMMPGEGGQEMTGGGQEMPDGGQEPMRPELMLNRINEIQAEERSNNSDDDVVKDILNTAANLPRGLTSTRLGPTISSMTQNSASSGGVTSRRISARAEYGADGMLDVFVRILSDSGSVTRLSTNEPEASVNRIKDIPAAGWKGVEFRDESTSWYYYLDALSDINGNSDSDYLVLGYWLRVRKQKRDDASNYGLGIFASGNDPFERSNTAPLTGEATYEGPATGLHMTKENADAAPAIDYFNAKASLTADFGDESAFGSVSGIITEGMTDGGVALPGLTLESADFTQSASNFHGDTSGGGLTGKWGGRFFGNGASATDHPGAVAGTFGAKTADDLQSIIGAFGAYKQ